MMRYKALWYSTFVLLIGIASCTYKKEALVHPAPAPIVTPTDTSHVVKDTTIHSTKKILTYNGDAKALFTKNCSACHGASVYQGSGGNINLDNFANVKIYKSSIKADLISNASKAMPKGSPTSYARADKDTIIKWIDNGALEK